MELDLYGDYETQIQTQSDFTTAPAAQFGDSYNAYNGATFFLVTDLSIPGNNDLAVKVQRRLQAYDDGVNEMFQWSGPALPYLNGLFKKAEGWQASVPNNPNLRCSYSGGSGEPPEVSQSSGKPGTFESSEYWHGNHLNLPESGNHLMMVPDGLTPPQDGGAYRWLTNNLWYFSCLPSTKNGVLGEGFLGVSPDGKRHYFDWIVKGSSAVSSIKKESFQGGDTVLSRDEYRALLTRVEDRFGNWINYTYSGTQLTGIAASDGRSVSLTYGACGLATVVAGNRVWTYGCAGGSSVSHPDGSVWKSVLTTTIARSTGSCDLANEPDRYAGQAMIEITLPSGALGKFTFKPLRTGLSFVPYNLNYPRCSRRPRMIDNVALYAKNISGVGVEPATWSFVYGPANACYVAGQLLPVCTPASPQTRIVTINGPQKSFVRYTFGNKYLSTDGLLVKTEVGENGIVLRGVDAQFLQLPLIGWRHTAAGDSDNRRPVEKVITISQQGATFTWNASAFDIYGNPTKIVRSSSLGYSLTEARTYYHSAAKWVLSRVSEIKQTAPDNSSMVPFKVVFDPAMSLPAAHYEFGRIIHQFTYHPVGGVGAGRVKTATDGNGKVTQFLSYKRGVPQNILLPAGGSTTAVVDDFGNITSVTDPEGFMTSYGYDAADRVKSIVYPAADSTNWSPVSITYQKVATEEYGIPANHWRRRWTSGARSQDTFYDASGQPILVRDYVSPNGPSQFVRRKFDYKGREVFSSYPVDMVGNYLTISNGYGSSFDALDRLTIQTRSSELGTLQTQWSFLAGFKVRETSPRGFTTTTSYQAWDTPEYSRATQISGAEGVNTSIGRDAFGRVKSMGRTGTYNGAQVAATRHYVYDAYSQVCKIVEPESGAVIQAYDGAGNLAWSAQSSTYTGITGCNTANVAEADKSIRSYDGANRVLGVNHPLGTADVSFTYFKDGSLKTASSDGSSWTYAYNKRRLLESESLAFDGKTFLIDWAYDSLGNTSSVIYPSGLVVSYQPNALGQPTKAGAYASAATYHPSGILKAFTYGNGISSETLLNSRRYPSRIRSYYGATNFLDHTYSYDESGNLEQIVDGTVDAPESRTLSYDGRERLVVANAPNAFGVEGFWYDPLDNVRRATIGPLDYRYVYDANQRLDKITDAENATMWDYAFSALGDITSRTNVSAGSTLAFAFDKAHRITSITGKESYRYDAHGRRLLSTKSAGGSKRYQIFDKSGVLMYVEDASSNKRTDYIYLRGQSVAKRSRPLASVVETVVYTHADGRGTPTIETTASRTTSSPALPRNTMTPFGAPYNGLYYDQLGLSGHQIDKATGLTYMQQRYYDHVAMRFLSVDPVASSAGSFNRYWYANNNPYRFIDPDGRWSCLGNAFDCGEFKGGLERVSDAASNTRLRQNEREVLKRIVAFYGEEGDKSVSVSFANLGGPGGNAHARNDGGYHVTIDLDAASRKSADRTMNVIARVVAHEGQHGVDDQRRGRPAATRGERTVDEVNGYTAQAYYQKAANFAESSADGWTTWGGLSESNIHRQAEGSVIVSCMTSNEGSCK